MTTRTVLTIGGVPEHFNLPWHLAREEGAFTDVGIDLQWTDCPGGTGEMVQGLAEGRLDLALPLSEGAVAAMGRGVPMRLLQWYVRSPLIWGIHVPAQSPLESVDALRGRRFAISRYGSGSHLMAYVNGQQRGWRPDTDLEFVEVGGLDGAIEAFQRSEADGFLWERFTTKPYVDQGLMRRVGECPTPWPAFALAASELALKEIPEVIDRAVRVINQACSEFKARVGIVSTIASRYGLQSDQAAEWFALTEWACDPAVNHEDLHTIIETLRSLGLLESSLAPEACLTQAARSR
jgi:ABC-type nitrate/sulfonate/bicarbonate transport system substrate-binding protein